MNSVGHGKTVPGQLVTNHEDPIEELRSFVLGPSWWQLTPLWRLESGRVWLLVFSSMDQPGSWWQDVYQLYELRLEASLFLFPHGPSPLQQLFPDKAVTLLNLKNTLLLNQHPSLLQTSHQAPFRHFCLKNKRVETKDLWNRIPSAWLKLCLPEVFNSWA